MEVSSLHHELSIFIAAIKSNEKTLRAQIELDTQGGNYVASSIHKVHADSLAKISEHLTYMLDKHFKKKAG
jgi:hypothetical protein